MPPKKKPLELKSQDMFALSTERQFQHAVTELARLNGWLVYSIPDSRRSTLSGWPDLTMIRRVDRRIVFAELKTEKGKIRPQQEEVLDVLTHIAGEGRTKKAEVYLWRPSDWDQIRRVLAR